MKGKLLALSINDDILKLFNLLVSFSREVSIVTEGADLLEIE